MATLLLPKLGAGNSASFNNNFTVSKDGNPWGDGGADTFDSTTGVQSGKNNQWVMLGGNAYTASDGSFTSSYSSSVPGAYVEAATYAGWVTAGIFALEVEYGFDADPDLRFWCNTGYDNGSPTGVTTKAFQLNGHDYELKTVHVSYGAKDTWGTTGETQLTVTIVPYLASLNAAGQNPFTWSGSGDDRDFRLSAVQRGATVYIQWGKVNVDDVQTWIVADLVESEEFTNAPHARLPIRNYPPIAFSAPLGLGYSVNNPLALLPGPHPRVSQPLKASWKNISQGGAGTIQGTVTIENIPGARQVRLFDKRSGLVVAETWSSPTGHYEFNNVATDREYFVVAHDHLRVYNAVVQDMLTP